MKTSDDRSRQQGGQQNAQPGSQPQGEQMQQQERSAQQQGGQSGSQQQQQYSPATSQQGGAMTRRGSAMPSLFGGRGSPFELFRRLDEDMDRLFDQFWGGNRSPMRGRGTDLQSMWMPDVEMCEKEGKLHVYADLPGMSKDEVNLSIEGDQLILQGERRSSHEEGQRGSGFYHTERSYGSFYRSIPLPEGVDPQTVDASFKDGVLDVSFEAPRGKQQGGRRIDIR